jgi:hypothetical protein
MGSFDRAVVVSLSLMGDVFFRMASKLSAIETTIVDVGVLISDTALARQ